MLQGWQNPNAYRDSDPDGALPPLMDGPEREVPRETHWGVF